VTHTERISLVRHKFYIEIIFRGGEEVGEGNNRV
jgi:hypothetical protein